MITIDRVVGAAIGGAIGLLSSFMINNTVRTAVVNPPTFGNALIASGKLVVSTVGVWFGIGAGTNWVSGKLFNQVASPTVVDWYFIALFVMLAIFTGRTLLRFAIYAGNSVPTK